MHISSIVAFSGLTSLALADPDSGCGTDIPPAFPSPGFSRSLHLPDSDREYILYIPETYNTSTPAPLYFSFHGATRDMASQEKLSQFSNPKFNKDAVVVYPNSKNGYWLSNPNADASKPDDLDFTAQLLTHMEEKLCIDASRVYSVGKSNGGGFTNVIACNDTVGARFAAFASVSGAYYDAESVPDVPPCEPAIRDEGFPFLELHGEDDTTAPIDGNTEENRKIPIIDILNFWTENNGCEQGAPPVANQTVFEDPVVKHVIWNCGGKDGIVQHYREGNNGHCWPSTESNNQCPMGKYVFDATEYIVDFFSKYQLDL
ncbi:hypothetical protein ASPSYDRAFT_62481 [Aspergillus sydowii CBS 593.65]|uniref:feruloyl esterase n=1 Tax=Aspergillus sydowii CBS 593.65 TaxID=1036612 RepID=A0A1L9T032_9EURO|nr:uncharacterized protein ASPSYDRAFT_62481 [Aspergillus sydowii CBS 593.65]OJJ52800.1 hypothetical protein ASPSYDRAFT_62481 [Aspergillus sydowii CBS 593.65]